MSLNSDLFQPDGERCVLIEFHDKQQNTGSEKRRLSEKRLEAGWGEERKDGGGEVGEGRGGRMTERWPRTGPARPLCGI